MTENNAESAGGSPKEAPAVSSRPANDLTAATKQLLSGGSRQLDAAALRNALLDLHEFWLTTKAAEIGITATSGFSIVATGGLGRGEMLPYSDLDLTLLHDNMPVELVSEVAEKLWYPLWDANIRIDHSVRTVPEALKVAGEDISVGLAMLDARHIAGDADLSALLVGGSRRQWRIGIASRFDELVEHARSRWERSGQIAHRAEPDLKSGRGGLRDVQLLNALAIAQLADVYPSRALASPTGTLGDAHLALLNVRTELHRALRPGPGAVAGTACRRDRRGPADRGPIRSGPHPLGCRAHRQLLRRFRDSHSRQCLTAAWLCRSAPPGAPSSRRRGDRVRGRGDPGPRRPAGTRSRPDPAGGGRVGHHRVADGGVHAEPTGRNRT